MDGSRRLFRSAIQSTHDRMKTEGSKLAGLVVTAIGIVFGDIGTSPLYAVRETFAGHHPLPVTSQNLYGVLSLVVWTIVIVVSVKYVSLIMRADNRGEGGSLALLALVSEVTKGTPAARFLLLLGIFAAALFYGDSMITPAISVLSAVEGLEVVTPQLESYVIPLTVVIITGLFALQNHGTATVGLMFGPIMVVWFLTLALLGFVNLMHAPEIFTPPTRSTGSASSSAIRSRASLPSDRCSSPPPAPRRSTPTWAISASCRFALPGSASSSRRCC